MNEILFLIQVFIIIGFALGARRLGESALVAWVAIQALIANLFVLKQITLFGFHVTASDSFGIGCLLGLSLLQEQYGRDAAKKATWVCFFFMAFFAIVSQLHLLYQPSTEDTTQASFVTILSQSPRLLAASLSVFFIVQRVDILFFNFVKTKFPSLSFAFRAAIVLTVSQFLDTVLFTFVGLYGLVSSMFDIIFLSFSIKLLVIFLNTSVIKWVKV